MELDFNSEESRKKYLKDKLDDLLEGISETYGTSLMEELVSRLELTVKDFNEEMTALCGELVKKEKERQQILDLIKSGDTGVAPIGDADKDGTDDSEIIKISDVETNEEELTEWEKKLSQLEDSKE